MRFILAHYRAIIGIFVVLLFTIAAAQRLQFSSPILCDRGQGIQCSPIGAQYFDANRSVEERAQDLLSRMTLDEKIAQMALVEKNSVSLAHVTQYQLGGLLSGGGGKPEQNTPQGWHDMVDQFQTAAKASRLSVPLLYGVDANHGHGNVPGATIFPHAIGLASVGDPALVEQTARATAEEVVATGINWNFIPSLDGPQDIRWGRIYETFGSDVDQVSRLGRAAVEGTQGVSLMNGVLATAKHFVGNGGMEWGTSLNSNFHIDQGKTPLSETTLRQEYLPPFAAAIDAGVGSVMVGLNHYGPTLVTSNTYLLTDILKGELNFKGIVVSDWYGVYALPGGNYQASVTAINAGVDMVMLPYDYRAFIRDVRRAVDQEEITKTRIDDAVLRILTQKFTLGVFDPRTEPALTVIGSTEHRALAREAAARSLVLLKNNNNALPITLDKTSRIQIAGSAADNIGRQVGGWTVEWQGIDGNGLPGATSILSGIRTTAGGAADIVYQADGKFDGADKADVGIAIVGETPYAEGEGDNAVPTLSDEDLAVVQRLRATSKKLIIVIVAGRPLLLGSELASADAVVMAWLPGSEGAGVADPLFGRTPFQGHLPLAWPARAKDLGNPAATPLFPRGFGLSL